MKRTRLVLLILLALAAPAAAQGPGSDCTFAQKGWGTLFLGVTSETFSMTCNGVSSTAHVVGVEVGRFAPPGISFETSGVPAGTSAAISVPAVFDQELPSAFMQRTRAQLAFNANLFTNCCCYDVTGAQPAQTYLIGLEISGGRILNEVQANPLALPDNCGNPGVMSFPFDHSLLVRGTALSIEKFAPGQSPQADAAITGSHMLVWDGENRAPTDTSGWYGPTARTVVGLRGDNSVLWIAAIDDNGPGQGATLSQAAQLMIRLGASRAINLDGGGSTTLVYEGADGMPHLINVPKDGATSCAFPPKSTVNCERYVGVSFAIHARPNRPAP